MSEIEHVEVDLSAVNTTGPLVDADTWYVIEFLQTNPKSTLHGQWFMTSGVPHKFPSYDKAYAWISNANNVRKLKEPWLPSRITMVQTTRTVIAQFSL